MKEIQQSSYGGHRVDEVNSGPILPFGSNYFALIRSLDPSVLKMIGISNFYPEPDVSRCVEIFYGHGQGVSGKGPHPGYPFVCSRIDGKQKMNDAMPDEAKELIASFEEQTRTLPEKVWDHVHSMFDPFSNFEKIKKIDPAEDGKLWEGFKIPADVFSDKHAPQCIKILRSMEKRKENLTSF
jgi:hypothetical protein